MGVGKISDPRPPPICRGFKCRSPQYFPHMHISPLLKPNIHRTLPAPTLAKKTILLNFGGGQNIGPKTPSHRFQMPKSAIFPTHHISPLLKPNIHRTLPAPTLAKKTILLGLDFGGGQNIGPKTPSHLPRFQMPKSAIFPTHAH